MGFAQAGTAIHDGDNLAIAGVKPSGIAAQGKVFWRASELLPWQLLNSVSAYAPAGFTTYSTTAIDTTGATLFVIGASLGTITDTYNNVWVLAAGTAQTFIYCLNPVTGPNHIFTFSNAQYGAAVISVFKGPSPLLDGRTQGPNLPVSATTAQAPPITPGKPKSLLVALFTGNGTASAVDGNFSITGNVPYHPGVGVGAASAYLIQETPTALSPNWSISMTYADGFAALISFVPS